jgi:hypothetical protein
MHCLPSDASNVGKVVTAHAFHQSSAISTHPVH